MTTRTIVTAAALAAITGCAHARPGKFADRAPVWRVDDERNVPEPRSRTFRGLSYFVDGYVFDPIEDAVDPPAKGPARDTNSLDEVPDSSWFINRIGMREVTPEEAARGAEGSGPPVPPLTIIRAKTIGDTPGFFVEDSRGSRYLMKFDAPANPEQQTGTDAIVNRIFWAIGYFVPSDHVVHVRRSDFRVSAELRDELGGNKLDRILRGATRDRRGAIRALASEFVPGEPKGGWPTSGTRRDDPNDRIAHQHRRVLRGLRVFSAWLGHTDVKPDNTLDVYVEEDGRRFLRHYLVDFGEAFGGHQSGKGQLEVGYEYGWDWAAQGAALMSFGLWVRDWEDQKRTPWKSVDYFGGAEFDPRKWRERYPYTPFQYTDRNDDYWAAKIIMRFDRDLLRAVVAKGELSEPAAADFLVETLLARRDEIGRAYLDAVAPLDELAIDSRRVCATDLMRRYGLVGNGVVERLGGAGGRYAEAPDGRVCIPIEPGGGYRMMRLRVRRDHVTTPAIHIHYRGGPDARILGLVRE